MISNQRTIEQLNVVIRKYPVVKYMRIEGHWNKTFCCTPKSDGIQIINTAFKCRIISYRVYSESKHTDFNEFFSHVKPKIISLLEDVINVHKSIKVNMETFAKYILQTRDTCDIKSFNSSNRILDESVDLDDILQKFIDMMTSQTSEFEEKDSGK
uniref:Uncharacterized protein n=1 Tax=Anoplophora glabripennis TaxID=217634 RepID=V5I8X1_ANOGL